MGIGTGEINSFESLEKLGRVRLSKYFFMRDFLYSEIGNYYGIPNIPTNPRLAIETGKRLCTDLLDPIVETFGPIVVRSSYRGEEVNAVGNEKNHNCSKNEANFAGHIWDKEDRHNRTGATACIIVPWFATQYERGRDWRDLAWWVHDHIPYSSIYFFPKLAAFNLNWRDQAIQQISSYIAPKGHLLRAGDEPNESIEARRSRYADFPAFRGLTYPNIPVRWSS